MQANPQLEVAPPAPGKAIRPSEATPGRKIHWESWLLRAALAASASFAAASGHPSDALAAVVAFLISLVPPGLWWSSRVHVPRIVELTFVLGVALPGISDALGLYDNIQHWGKLVHGAEGFCIAALAAFLLLGYRDLVGLDVPTQLLALVSICAGVTFGAFWEFLEFFQDWVRYSDLQKSNADTMTDMLWNDFAAVLAALVAFRAYYHWTSARQHGEMGALAAWLWTPAGRTLDRHGAVVGFLVLLVTAVFIGGLWIAGRGVPGLPTG